MLIQEQSAIIQGEHMNEHTKTQLWVDGYNVIFADKDLASLARCDIHAAQNALIELVAEYASLCGYTPVIFFDHETNDSMVTEDTVLGVRIVTGNRTMSADSLMEKMNFETNKDVPVVLVTSDRLLRDMVGHRNGNSRTIASRDFIPDCKAVRHKNVPSGSPDPSRQGLYAHLPPSTREELEERRGR